MHSVPTGVPLIHCHLPFHSASRTYSFNAQLPQMANDRGRSVDSKRKRQEKQHRSVGWRLSEWEEITSSLTIIVCDALHFLHFDFAFFLFFLLHFSGRVYLADDTLDTPHTHTHAHCSSQLLQLIRWNVCIVYYVLLGITLALTLLCTSCESSTSLINLPQKENDAENTADTRRRHRCRWRRRRRIFEEASNAATNFLMQRKKFAVYAHFFYQFSCFLLLYSLALRMQSCVGLCAQSAVCRTSQTS